MIPRSRNEFEDLGINDSEISESILELLQDRDFNLGICIFCS